MTSKGLVHTATAHPTGERWPTSSGSSRHQVHTIFKQTYDRAQAIPSATAATFDRAKDGQVLASLVPEAVRVTAANNRLGWLRANPWH